MVNTKVMRKEKLRELLLDLPMVVMSDKRMVRLSDSQLVEMLVASLALATE